MRSYITNKIIRGSRFSLASCLLVLTLQYTVGAQTPSQKANKASAVLDGQEQTISRTELEVDERLNVPVVFNAPSITLNQCVSELARISKVPLVVADSVKTRRVMVFTSKLPLRSLMSAFARVTGFSWRNLASTSKNSKIVSAGYELYQPIQSRLNEQAAIRGSEQREQVELTAKSDATLTAINRSLRGRTNDQPSFADVLGDLSPEQLQQLARCAAPNDVGIITAGNNGYMHNHLLFTKPFASFPPGIQQSLCIQLGNPHSAFNGQQITYPDISTRQLGFVAMNGDVRLAIVNSDGKDLNTTHLSIHRKGLPGVDSDDGSSSEVSQAIDANMISLDGLTRVNQSKGLHFARGLQRKYLANVLESITAQTGISIVSDDYLSSRSAPYEWLLTNKDEYTLREALDQIARAFAHRIRYNNGVLCVTTVTLGLDLRGEPPAEAVARMSEVAAEKLPMQLKDYVLLGGITRLQCRMMPAAVRYGETQAAVQTNMQRLYSILHFYGLLSAAQREMAERKEGLPMVDIRGGALSAINPLVGCGLPALLPTAEMPVKAGFYVRRVKNSGRLQEVQFLIVSNAAQKNVVMYRLHLP